jgi:hypothetical protein
LIVVAACLLLAVSRAAGAPPVVKFLFPAGAQRGVETEVTANGTFAKWPPRLWTSSDDLTFTPEKKSGKLTVRIDADAPPGPRLVRFIDDEGSSAARVFIVGAVAETKEVEPNDLVAQAQRIEQPAVVVNGALAQNGEVDCFRFSLKAGQTLVASVDAWAALGSPIDAVAQLTDDAGHVLAQRQDDRGPDPQLVFKVDRDGEYVVRLFGLASVPNSSIRLSGSEEAIYRLTLTTGPFVDGAWPAVVSNQASAETGLRGWNLPTPRPVLLTSEAALWQRLTVPCDVAGWATAVVVDSPAVVESRESMKITAPVAVSGLIGRPGENDAYLLTMKKGESQRLRVVAKALNVTLDPVVHVYKPDGTLLVRLDDIARNDGDVDGVITAAADGEYRIVVEDLFGDGGERSVYVLDLRPAATDFGLSVAAAEVSGTVGKPIEIAVTIDRPKQNAGEIEVRLEGPAELGEVKAVSTNKGAEAKRVSLKFTPTKPLSGPVRVTGVLRGEAEVRRVAAAPLAAVPGGRVETLWLTVTKK